MRIGIDARMIDNTGIGRYLQNLLVHLARIDTHNDYIVFVNAENSRVVQQENIRFVPLKIRVPLYSLREQWWLPWEIRQWPLDLIHYPNFDMPLLPLYPSIVTIHDLIYYLYPDQCPSKIAHYYARFMLRQATRKASLLITDSEYSKRDLIAHFQVPAEKIQVIFPAADQRAHPSQSPETSVVKKYGITKPYILYVGKHHPYKNIRTLLHAFNVHKNIYERFQLVIAGKKDLRRKDLYQEAEALYAGQAIVFTDFVSEDDLFELYRQARLFVFPSLYEGFGLPPLEAMACGVPVITSTAASLPEVVGDAAIQVEPLDVQGFADAMQSVLTDESLWQEFQWKGLQQAQYFSWDTAAQQLLEIYERFGR
jgi:glycosyltransferase involved in cell wall biosynthesis